MSSCWLVVKLRYDAAPRPQRIRWRSAPPPEVALPCLWLWCTCFMTRVRSFFPRAALGIPAELSANRTTSDPSTLEQGRGLLQHARLYSLKTRYVWGQSTSQQRLRTRTVYMFL